jgi:hypothetical protein
MQVRSCRVTIRDIDGLAHSVDVTAATLFEAVAHAIAALRRDDWVAGIPGGMNVVKVSVSTVRVDHEATRSKWVILSAGLRSRVGHLVSWLSARIKEPGRQINYGTGEDVSTETIQNAKAPLEIHWYGDSYLDLRVRR